jgi:hypothetical protein
MYSDNNKSQIVNTEKLSDIPKWTRKHTRTTICIRNVVAAMLVVLLGIAIGVILHQRMLVEQLQTSVDREGDMLRMRSDWIEAKWKE